MSNSATDKPGDAAQNAQQTHLHPLRATKRRRSIKPPVLKEAVIAHALLGANNSQIAKDLQIDRSTVKTILSSAEIQRHIEEGRSRAVSLIPRSLDVVENRLEKNDGSVAISVLRGTQVLQSQQVTTNQTNIQANTWLVMRDRKTMEQEEQAITVTVPENSATSE